MNFYLRKLFSADLDSEPKTCSVQHIHAPKVRKHLCWLLWKEKTTRKLSQRHDQSCWSSKDRTQGRAGNDHSNSIEKPRPVGEREQTETPNTDHIVSWVWIVYGMISNNTANISWQSQLYTSTGGRKWVRHISISILNMTCLAS